MIRNNTQGEHEMLARDATREHGLAMSEATATLEQPEAPQASEGQTQSSGERYPLKTWLAVRKDFIAGLGSVNDCCKLPGVNYQTAKTRAFKEQWVKLRDAAIARQMAQDEPQPVEPTQPTPAPPKDVADPFREESLARVRKQLTTLDLLFETESEKPNPDTKRLKELSDSIKSLSIREFDLSGRLKSGTMRPKAERSPRQSANVQPLD